MDFIAYHGLWTGEQQAAAKDVLKACGREHADTLRLSFPDQHGMLRGKTLTADECASVFRSGCTMTSTLLLKDTSHKTVFPVFMAGGGLGESELQGAADLIMVPDPTTFRMLPWAPRTGWMLCDLYFRDGRPVPLSTRHQYRRALERLARIDADYIAGLEVEFHVFKRADQDIRAEAAGQPGQPPEVSLLNTGYQYLTEQRFDQIEPVLEIIRSNVEALGLPLRSIEVEFGPSQCEFTFKPGVGMNPADDMVLFRSAVKQICHRHGYHATFMCRPKMPNVISSGWHLHQSLVSRKDGSNLFMPTEDGSYLSPLGMNYLGGLMKHARASAVFSTPTINGYKRYRSYSLAPDRVNWGRDNRGVMLRVLGAPNDTASRIENRIGEPLANPYLYMGSQILAGLNGIEEAMDPGPPADSPYEMDAVLLPKSLREAVGALRDDPFVRDAFGQKFVDYFSDIKMAEVARYEETVTDWEHREYFSDF